MDSKPKHFRLTASEFPWKVSDNLTITATGFNNQVPGPALKVTRGDTVVVNVTNELKEPTIVHWHGIRLQSAMDGTEESQKAILPGETFEYRFVVPDAGTFWYHSHYNETVQMERGLYGAVIVKDENDPVVDIERVLMIDDMKLSGSEFSPGNFISRWVERHDGRQGDTLLINGKQLPEIAVNAGQIERWRLINSSSARYFRLYLEGKEFQVIASDGGLLEAPITATEALLTPGERIDILIGPFDKGDSFFVESLPYNRMTFLKSQREKFAHVAVGEHRPSIAQIPQQFHRIPSIADLHDAITRKIKFSVGPSLKRGIDFLVNNSMHLNDQPVKVGERQIWEISNTSLMDHPFHLHGFFFQVLSVNGKVPSHRSWKDTINLPPRSKTKIAWIPDNRPGKWMYHCHILEHHHAGMMANFEVLGANDKPSLVRHHHHH